MKKKPSNSKKKFIYRKNASLSCDNDYKILYELLTENERNLETYPFHDEIEAQLLSFALKG